MPQLIHLYNGFKDISYTEQQLYMGLVLFPPTEHMRKSEAREGVSLPQSHAENQGMKPLPLPTSAVLWASISPPMLWTGGQPGMSWFPLFPLAPEHPHPSHPTERGTPGPHSP